VISPERGYPFAKRSCHSWKGNAYHEKFYQIFKWDGADVRDLKRWIKELKEICEKIGLNARDLINFKKLTGQPVPDDVVKYPVYALDRQGYCLIGVNHDEVLHISEVRERIEENSS